MRIYDISQEVFSSRVYPGDPVPQKQSVCSMDKGDQYNLTAFSMCAHNGTHVDAPCHFINGGKCVSQIPLSKTVGWAYVTAQEGVLDAEGALSILKHAKNENPDAARRILLKGRVVVSEDAAKVFAQAGVDLVGNESQTVGPEEAPGQVHRILLAKEVVLLEGIRLGDVAQGVYFLFSAPLSLSGADGAPVRAVLIGKD